MNKPTKADDLETLLLALHGAPVDGLSIKELQAATGWVHSRVNERLADLGGRVRHKKVRVKNVSSINYYLNVPGV